MILRLRSDDLDWREIDDEIVALDRRDATYIAVNGAGALLWRSLASDATRQELVSALVEAYGIDEARAGADIDSFLDALAERGLLL